MDQKAFRQLITVVTLMTGALLASQPASAMPVDLELSLLVDVSASISRKDFELQRTGYKKAFQDSEITQAINDGVYKKIAVNMIYWSGKDKQQVVVPWTLVTADNAYGFGEALGAANRPSYSGLTSISGALDFAYPKFADNGYEGTRTIIDISGDGENNSGHDPKKARDEALANGVDTINGIVIGKDICLYNHYKHNVIGGDDAFLMKVDDFEDFELAIKKKLHQEIDDDGHCRPVPEPATLSLWGFGMLGLAGYRRAKKI